MIIFHKFSIKFHVFQVLPRDAVEERVLEAAAVELVVRDLRHLAERWVDCGADRPPQKWNLSRSSDMCSVENAFRVYILLFEICIWFRS